MGELLRLVVGDAEPWAEEGGLAPLAASYLHPDTAALYRALSRRPQARRPAAAGRAFARL